MSWSNLLELQFRFCCRPYHTVFLTCFPCYCFCLFSSTYCKVRQQIFYYVCFVVSQLHNMASPVNFYCIFVYIWIFLFTWRYSYRRFDFFLSNSFSDEYFFALDVLYKRQVSYSYNLTSNVRFP